jgi:CheY-like chemotaxis protein
MALRVVIFEDEQVTRETLSRLISSRGHEVHSFPDPSCCQLYSGATCNCTEREACADILITDNQMPVMTGLQFIRRQYERGCRGIVNNKAIVTGCLSSEELEQSRQLGCKVFSKPLNWREMQQWLEECEKLVRPSRRLVNV